MMEKDLTMENGKENASRNAEEDHDDVSKKMAAAVPPSVSSSSHHGYWPTSYLRPHTEWLTTLKDHQVTKESIAPSTNINGHCQILKTSDVGKIDSGTATMAADTSISSRSDQKIARKPVGSSSADLSSDDFGMFLEGFPESSQDNTATTTSALASRHAVYAIIEDPGYNPNDIPAIGTSVRGNDHHEYERKESILSFLDPDNVRNQTPSTIPAEYNRSKDHENNRASDTRSTPKPSVFTLDDKLSLFPPCTFSPNAVREADNLFSASNGPLATNVNPRVPTSLRSRRAAASIPHMVLQSGLEGSITRKPINAASTLESSTVGLAFSVYSDTQKIATFGPPENNDLSCFFHKFHLHPSSAYPRTLVGLGNSYHENVAHSTFEADVNLNIEQERKAENNKKIEMAKSNAKTDVRAGKEVSGDGMVDDELSHNVSSESRHINAYATYEIEYDLRIRGARGGHTLVTKPDKECQTMVSVFKS